MPYNPNNQFNNSSDDVSISANSVFDWGNASVLGRAAGGRGGSGGGSAGGGSASAAGSYSSYSAAVAREQQQQQQSNTDNTSHNDNNNNNNNEPTSRYDPKAMSRIVDITDLVDESSDGEESDDDDIICGGTGGTFGGMGMPGHGRGGHHGSSASGGLFSNTNNNNTRGTTTTIPTKGLGGASGGRKKNHYSPGANCRQVMIMVSLVAVIVGAILALGFSVVSGDIPVSSRGSSSSSSSSNSNSNSNNVAPSTSEPNDQQLLLETAERVILACSPSQLDVDMSECQSLCHGSMCCFEDKGGEYNCEEDESKLCSVYAGCEALLEGSLVDGEEVVED